MPLQWPLFLQQAGWAHHLVVSGSQAQEARPRVQVLVKPVGVTEASIPSA